MLDKFKKMKKKDKPVKEHNIYKELDRSLLITSIITSLALGTTFGSIATAFHYGNKQSKKEIKPTSTPDNESNKYDLYINDDYLLKVYENDYKLKVNYKSINDNLYFAKTTHKNNKKSNYFLAYDTIETKNKKIVYDVFALPSNNYQFSVNKNGKIVNGPDNIKFERLGSLGKSLLTYSNNLKINKDYIICSKANIDILLKEIEKNDQPKKLTKTKNKKMN